MIVAKRGKRSKGTEGVEAKDDGKNRKGLERSGGG